MSWIFLPLGGGGGGGSQYYGDPVPEQSMLPATGSLGEIRYAILENQFFTWNGAAWVVAPADVTDARFINTTSPLAGGGQLNGDLTLSLLQSGSAQDGYLSSADWSTFNAKEAAIAAGTTSQYWRGDKTWQTLNTDAIITSDGSAASGGDKLGEEISSSEPSSLGPSGIGVTGVWGAAASVLVPPGRWALGATAYVTQNDANLSNLVQAGLSTEAAPASLNRSQTASTSFLITGDFEHSLAIATRVFTFAAPTTVYVNTKFIYDSGTPHHAGYITGWRIS